MFSHICCIGYAQETFLLFQLLFLVPSSLYMIKQLMMLWCPFKWRNIWRYNKEYLVYYVYRLFIFPLGYSIYIKKPTVIELCYTCLTLKMLLRCHRSGASNSNTQWAKMKKWVLVEGRTGSMFIAKRIEMNLLHTGPSLPTGRSCRLRGASPCGGCLNWAEKAAHLCAYAAQLVWRGTVSPLRGPTSKTEGLII